MTRRPPGSIRQTASLLRQGATPQVMLSALKTLEQAGIPAAGVSIAGQTQIGGKAWWAMASAVIGALRSLWQNAVANAQTLAAAEVVTPLIRSVTPSNTSPADTPDPPAEPEVQPSPPTTVLPSRAPPQTSHAIGGIPTPSLVNSTTGSSTSTEPRPPSPPPTPTT